MDYAPAHLGEQRARDYPEFLDIERLADVLGVRVGHIRSLVAKHKIPVGRVGRLVRFHWPTILRWLTEGAEDIAPVSTESAEARP